MSDAARSAITVVQLLRAKDSRGLADLVLTMDDAEKSAPCGSLGALASSALDTLDQVTARYSLPGNSAQLLAIMAADFAAE